ncbi:cyclin-dependent kinase 2-associated protein 2-like [Chironomus tepperi]|uniref:cyclin-dependent kinase 2-associated protein 2-like n=1 Tax=Chironomus tepperi TaxID=113505 RepID=UPI00391F8486
MNSQSRRELEFLQEQALLLEKNSVSLTQITPKTNNNNGTKQQNSITPSVNITPNVNITPSIQQPTSTSPSSNLSKYSQLLMVIEEMSKDIRPTYSGSRSSAERLKRTIVTARILVRECLLETERQQSGR